MRGFATLLVIIVTIAVTALPASAGPGDEIHCTGNTGNHGAGNAPQAEELQGGGQCHGTPGDDGNCNGNYENQIPFTVSCTTGTKPSGTEFSTCFASLNCAPNYSINCGGNNREAFAGVMQINGEPVGFVSCSGAEPEFCP